MAKMRQDEITELIKDHVHRLQRLKRRQAQLGLSADVSLEQEIDDIETKIEALQAELEAERPDQVEVVPGDTSPLKIKPPLEVSLDRVAGLKYSTRTLIIALIVLIGAGLVGLFYWFGNYDRFFSTTATVTTTAQASTTNTTTEPPPKSPDGSATITLSPITDGSVTATPRCTPAPLPELPPHAMAIIEPVEGASSEVPLTTLAYEKRSGLRLASGLTIDFKRMTHFELFNKKFGPDFTTEVTITFLNCVIHQDVIKSESGSFLTGETEIARLQLHILEVERVVFQW